MFECCNKPEANKKRREKNQAQQFGATFLICRSQYQHPYLCGDVIQMWLRVVASLWACMSLLQEHKHQGAYLCVTSASGVCEASLHLHMCQSTAQSPAYKCTPLPFSRHPKCFHSSLDSSQMLELTHSHFCFKSISWFRFQISWVFIWERICWKLLCAVSCPLIPNCRFLQFIFSFDAWQVSLLYKYIVHPALNQQLNNWHLNRTYSGDVTEVLLIIQIKLVHFSCQTMYSGDFSKN